MLGAACTKATEADGAARLTIVQGNQQVAPVGSLLPLPVVLRVLSATGAPVAQVPVQFSVQAGGGSVDPGTVTSDANGEVKTKWTLGPTATAHLLSGTAAGVDTVTVVATGVAPREVVVVQGDGQSARAGAALATPIVLRVVGGTNLPIPGQTVTFAVRTGGGSVSPATAVTSAAGEVTLRWTLGPVPGNQTVTVTVGALTPITLTALAN
jgi:adhesin/invasin